MGKLLATFLSGLIIGATIALNYNFPLQTWKPDWTANYWNAVGALGQWAGAIATVAAVVIALKTTYDASQNRIKVETSLGFITGLPQEGVQMIFFTAINIGIRQVQLRSSGVILPNNEQLIFPGDTAEKLPATLQSSDQVTYWVVFEDIKNVLREKKLQGSIKVKVFFSDSLGTRHWGKLKINLDD